MSAISAFLHRVEAGASHIVSVVETDFTTMEHKVIAAIQVVNGDMTSVWEKVQSEATAEINRIEADATAAKQKVAAKIAAVKQALGV